jgi:hypothetical protein
MSQETHSSKKLPMMSAMIDDPGPFGTVEKWEQYLTAVQSTADSVLKPSLISRAQRMIKMRKEDQKKRSTKA